MAARGYGTYICATEKPAGDILDKRTNKLQNMSRNISVLSYAENLGIQNASKSYK